MTANDIIDTLVSTNPDNCIWATELAFSGGARRIDYWTLHPYRSKGYLARSYEVKISKADFKRDSHKKQREARLYCDQFYYVTPPNLIALEDIPDWAGLIEIHNGKRKYIMEAPIRDKDAPSWELVISLIRNSGRIRRDEDIKTKQLKQYKTTCETAKKKLREDGIEAWKYGLI